jgi:hypothetical protein
MRNLFCLVAAAIISVVSIAHAKTDGVLPVNLEVQDMLARDVTQLYSQSPTFRAQCDRLAQAQNLHVTMKVDTAIPHSCRAYTIITRTKGVLCAEVHLPPTAQLAELMGHEVEHILEQLEHLNLRKLAQVRGSGVREVGFELFETDRAQAAGKIVAEELRLAKASASSYHLPDLSKTGN